jgi:hypothetical protein
MHGLVHFFCLELLLILKLRVITTSTCTESMYTPTATMLYIDLWEPSSFLETFWTTLN